MRRNTKMFLVVGLIVTLALAMVVGPFASSAPDGLEKVADQEGFATDSDHDLAASPLTDYSVDGVDDGRLGTALAGAIGVLLTFAIGAGLFVAIRRTRPRLE